MTFAKRILLFIGVNLLVVTVISILLSVLNVQPYLDQYGLNIGSLAVFCLIWGMAGSIISLLMSRAMAKWVYGVQVIDPNNCSAEQRRILQTVYDICRRAGITTMPEVGIYQSDEANAFATGPSQSRALVAVSSGLFSTMNSDEIEGVLGHEVTHIVNGDMVTMTLLQGIVNAFVMFISRIIAFALTRSSSGGRERSSGASFYLITMLLQSVLMILGAILVASYSRRRECSADDGGARLAGQDKMIHALQALQRTYDRLDNHAQPEAQTLKISSAPMGIWALFATHPPLEERIERLRNAHIVSR